MYVIGSKGQDHTHTHTYTYTLLTQLHSSFLLHSTLILFIHTIHPYQKFTIITILSTILCTHYTPISFTPLFQTTFRYSSLSISLPSLCANSCCNTFSNKVCLIYLILVIYYSPAQSWITQYLWLREESTIPSSYKVHTHKAPFNGSILTSIRIPFITSINILFRPNQVMFSNVVTTNIVTKSGGEEVTISPGYYTLSEIITILNTMTNTSFSISTMDTSYGCI